MSRLPTFTGANGKFQVVDGLLYKHALNDVAGKERLASLALVVPKGLTLSILINLHKELNHPGRDKMLAVLRTRVYWKKLSSQVAEFVAGCRICQHRHLKNAVYRQMRIKPPRGPGIRLAIDCWSGEGARPSQPSICILATRLLSQFQTKGHNRSVMPCRTSFRT